MRRTVSVALAEEMLAEIDKHAVAAGRDRSSQVRVMLGEWLARKRATPRDGGVDAGSGLATARRTQG